MSRLSLHFSCAALIAGLVIATSLSAQGRRPGGGFGGGGLGETIRLAGNEAVQKEIGVTDEQKANLKTLGEEYTKESESVWTAAGATREGGFRNLTDDQRTKLAEGMKTLSETYSPKVKETLKPEQFERLQQISYQIAGPAAYNNPEVVKALELTKEQQEKIAAITRDYGEKQRALRGEGGREAASKLRDEQNAELAKVLTKEQSEKFTSLKGKEFDTSVLFRGAPGGGKRGEKKVD